MTIAPNSLVRSISGLRVLHSLFCEVWSISRPVSRQFERASLFGRGAHRTDYSRSRGYRVAGFSCDLKESLIHTLLPTIPAASLKRIASSIALGLCGVITT